MDSLQSHLLSLLEASLDGYGLIDSTGTIQYANDACLNLLFIHSNEIGSIKFEQVLRRNYANNRGARIDDNDVDSFIEKVRYVQGTKPYRLFEVDYVDNRWFLISEQIDGSGCMLIQIKDITRQKIKQLDLESTITTYQHLALTDELTGLANRRALVDSVHAEISRLGRLDAPGTMLVVDVDHFKKVNDTYGHQVGDIALRHCADIFKTCLRPSDILGRIGGEEFAVFLADTNKETGLRIAERIRQALESCPFTHASNTLTITVSIGLATCSGNLSFESLYEHADSALYLAKQSGRNQVQCAPSANAGLIS